jgi:hypothetical protein
MAARSQLVVPLAAAALVAIVTPAALRTTADKGVEGEDGA